MKVLIDLDLVVYRVGAACDNWHYNYLGERFNSHKELKTYLKSTFSGDQERIDKGLSDAVRERDPEDWEATRDSVVSFVEDLVEEYEDYQGFISGSGNFRYRVATILPYKGNRDDSVKPFHYDSIRQLLVDAYGAQMSQNMEADDCLGLAQDGDRTIIASVDKDLDIIPGWHWNWERDKKYYVSPEDGLVSFYKQMLTGDSTDNILGLYGVGPSSKLLKNIDDMKEDMEEVHNYVISQYEARFGNHAPLFYMENAKLLWILNSQRNPFTIEEYWK
jgi:hypothetical protein